MGQHLIHLTKADYRVSQWSGGTTTELAIAPKGAVYGYRNFLWRLSSATVDLEESDFTTLPDYNRLIVPLQGEMILSHDDGDPVVLQPYQVHGFDGAAKTRSKGRCVDFNLMLRKGACEGSVFPVEAEAGGSLVLGPSLAPTELLLYCLEGCSVVSFCYENVTILPGETVRALDLSAGQLEVKSLEKSFFMAAELFNH